MLAEWSCSGSLTSEICDLSWSSSAVTEASSAKQLSLSRLMWLMSKLYLNLSWSSYLMSYSYFSQDTCADLSVSSLKPSDPEDWIYLSGFSPFSFRYDVRNTLYICSHSCFSPWILWKFSSNWIFSFRSRSYSWSLLEGESASLFGDLCTELSAERFG